jgi:hypothetical protein
MNRLNIAQFLSIGMPYVCSKTHPPNITNVLSMKNSSIFWWYQFQITFCRVRVVLFWFFLCFFLYCFLQGNLIYFAHSVNGFQVDNTFVMFGGCVFEQTYGIPMDRNCAPLIADLFLYSYKVGLMYKKTNMRGWQLLPAEPCVRAECYPHLIQ